MSAQQQDLRGVGTHSTTEKAGREAENDENVQMPVVLQSELGEAGLGGNHMKGLWEGWGQMWVKVGKTLHFTLMSLLAL